MTRRLWLSLILTLSLLASNCAVYKRHKEIAALDKKLSDADKELPTLVEKPKPIQKNLSEIDLSKIGHISIGIEPVVQCTLYLRILYSVAK